MSFNSFTTQIIIRVLLLFGNLIIIAQLQNKYTLWFTLFCLIGLAIIQVIELILFVNRLQAELNRFFSAIKYNDFNTRFNNPKIGLRFSGLQDTFQSISEKLRTSKIEKEGQLMLFKTLMEKLQIGMIAYHPKKGNIVLMNQAASQLLGIPQQKSWSQIKNRMSWFTTVVEGIPYGGRKLASTNNVLGTKEFSIDVGFVKVNDENFALISFQDIKDEIEQKEIEAWHKLIRILTHEIMNSITPVSSLSETMVDMLQGPDKKPLESSDLDKDTIEDLLLAVNTIHRRSNGMLDFVNDYRKLTKIPAPNFEMIRVTEIFEDILLLMKADLERRNIKATIGKDSQHLHLKCDKTLVEQIIINLFSNSFYALKNTVNPEIKLNAFATEETITLSFTDNGSGIEKEKLERIFIPFYSTKEEGSGIGLALSKNIMQLHQGNLKVNSIPNKETTFNLIFLNHAYRTLA